MIEKFLLLYKNTHIPMKETGRLSVYNFLTIFFSFHFYTFNWFYFYLTFTVLVLISYVILVKIQTYIPFEG